MPREIPTSRNTRPGLLLLSVLGMAAIAADRPAASPAPVQKAAARRPAAVTPAPQSKAPHAQPPKPAPGPAAAKALAARDNEMEVLIAQALDQKTSIELKDIPIREGIQQLAEKTGIPIEVESGTVRFLPYGSETRVTVSVAGQPLSEVLNAIVRPIGLKYAVENNKVIVRASKPLVRLARRAKWSELTLLDMLRTRPWSDDLFANLKIQFQDPRIADLDASRKDIQTEAKGIGAGTAAQILEHATEKFGWTWYPADDHVVILAKPKQIERQLERHVTLQYKEVPLKDVLLDLADQADVNLKLDPGVLMTGAATAAYTLAVENATVRQMFDIVSGQTGLGYIIEPDGVRIVNNATGVPASTSQAASSAEDIANRAANMMRSNSFVGTITIPGKDGATYSFFIRENDLPPDVNELRKMWTKDSGERLRAALTTATQPQN